MHWTDSLPDLPSVLVQAELADHAVRLSVDESVYGLDSVYGASFTFLDRAFVFLDRSAEGKLRVTLTDKSGEVEAVALRALVGEFANELLACAWRQRITEANRETLEAVTKRAIAGAMGPPSLEELADFDFTEEPFDDPLGIALNWEDKHAGSKDDES